MRFMTVALFPFHVFMCAGERLKCWESHIEKTRSKTYANHRKCMKKSKRSLGREVEDFLKREKVRGQRSWNKVNKDIDCHKPSGWVTMVPYYVLGI